MAILGKSGHLWKNPEKTVKTAAELRMGTLLIADATRARYSSQRQNAFPDSLGVRRQHVAMNAPRSVLSVRSTTADVTPRAANDYDFTGRRNVLRESPLSPFAIGARPETSPASRAGEEHSKCENTAA